MLLKGSDFADLSLRLCPKKAQPLQFLEGSQDGAAGWGGSQGPVLWYFWPLTFFRDLPAWSEWLGSSLRALQSSVLGPGDEPLTWHLPLWPWALAAAPSLLALEAAGAADIRWAANLEIWQESSLLCRRRCQVRKGSWCPVPALLKAGGAREQTGAARSSQGKQGPPGTAEENQQPKALFLFSVLQAPLPRGLPKWVMNVLVHQEITWFGGTESSMLLNEHPSLLWPLTLPLTPCWTILGNTSLCATCTHSNWESLLEHRPCEALIYYELSTQLIRRTAGKYGLLGLLDGSFLCQPIFVIHMWTEISLAFVSVFLL